MENKLAEVLSNLAEVLGTTVDKLWGVLLRQAPISGTIDLTICIILIVASVCLFCFVWYKTARRNACRLDWNGDYALFAWTFAIVFGLFTFWVVLTNAESIVSSFVNPEFWALQKLLLK